MRLKVVIQIIAVGVILLFAFQAARPRQHWADPHTAFADAANVQIHPERSSVHNSRRKPAASSDSAAASDEVSEEARSEWVAVRIAELMDLAMTDDPASLETILSELNSSDSRIREAALEAAVQFKSPDAFPALRQAADRANDPEEKLSILKAIEFLSSAASAKVSGT